MDKNRNAKNVEDDDENAMIILSTVCRSGRVFSFGAEGGEVKTSTLHPRLGAFVCSCSARARARACNPGPHSCSLPYHPTSYGQRSEGLQIMYTCVTRVDAAL